MTETEIIGVLEDCGCESCIACINLINRQKAELKQTQSLYEERIAELKAEIERLKAERDTMHKDLVTAEEYAWSLKKRLEEIAKEVVGED